MDPLVLERLNRERRHRRAVILLTDLKDGRNRLFCEGEIVACAVLSNTIETAFRTGKSCVVDVYSCTYFVNVHVPPTRLVVIGAVHISQALASIAKIAGYDVEIIDPRTAFATPDRFPDVPLHTEWPENVLKNQPLDAFTAVAALTHDPKIDDLPLMAALDAGCFYIGALGSSKTHVKRVERLRALGATSDQVRRIHAPIGLDIGAASPAQIAVAVLAQVIKAFHLRGSDRETEKAA
ncbi:XdhC family protein [Phyllobacterium sp. SB3]|uniref:XdhC family protein n=1 Tax=Phyllobacterium sp. SB3 TaxID=3156073 RepID=UPI0032AF6A61